MLCAIVLAQPVHAQATVDGWTLTVRTTYDSSGSSGPRSVANRYRIIRGMVRTDVVDQSPVAGSSPSSIATIVNDSAHTITLLNERGRRATYPGSSSFVRFCVMRLLLRPPATHRCRTRFSDSALAAKNSSRV